MTRVRRRLAALATTPDRAVGLPRLERALVAADVELAPSAAVQRLAWLATGGAAAGALLAGFPGMTIAPLAVVAGAALWIRRRRAGRLERLAAQFPEALRSMADALRSGLNLGQAVDLAATDAGPPLGAELRRASRETTVGTPLDRALGAFAQRCAVPGADVLAVASAIASRTGADLAPILDGIVAAARDRDRLRREMRAATAQGRLTAMVVAALPFAFLLVLGAGARGETHVLLHEPIGWVLLGVGGGLQAAGFLWIRRTVRS